jgi:hypothetical protein
LKHVEQVAYNWPYCYDRWEDEEFIMDSRDWEEDLERMRNPHMMVFNILSIEEQEIDINMALATQRDETKVEEAIR